jgi:hypothetical protein
VDQYFQDELGGEAQEVELLISCYDGGHFSELPKVY